MECFVPLLACQYWFSLRHCSDDVVNCQQSRIAAYVKKYDKYFCHYYAYINVIIININHIKIFILKFLLQSLVNYVFIENQWLCKNVIEIKGKKVNIVKIKLMLVIVITAVKIEHYTILTYVEYVAEKKWHFV